MTIRLLTGATGFVGGTVVLELLERTMASSTPWCAAATTR